MAGGEETDEAKAAAELYTTVSHLTGRFLTLCYSEFDIWDKKGNNYWFSVMVTILTFVIATYVVLCSLIFRRFIYAFSLCLESLAGRIHFFNENLCSLR